MSEITIEEIMASDWYKTRPDVIKQAIRILPPGKYYKFKNSGKQCFIYSYEEPESGKLEDVTVSVHKTGIGGPLAGTEVGEYTGMLDSHQRVFGVKLDDLEPWE